MKIYVIEDNPVYNEFVCNLLKKKVSGPNRHTTSTPPKNC